MVNVNKNIMPDKSDTKTRMKAPARRPRNQKLNNSKKRAAHAQRRSLNNAKFNLLVKSLLNSSKNLDCSEDGVADVTITTESGNEISMQDIKIVQNPDTNELAIFIPEDEEETIPDGFTIIGSVIPDAGSTPTIEEDAEIEEDDEMGEDLEASKKAMNCNRRDLPRKHPAKRKSKSLNCATTSNSAEHEMFIDVVEALETLGYDDQVKEEMFPNQEGSLKELLADVDEHEAFTEIMKTIDELYMVDEVMSVIFGNYDPLDDVGFVSDVDSSSRRRLDSSLDEDDEYEDSSDDVSIRYKGYFITGNDRIGYVGMSPYGKYSPKSYATVDEAKEAIDKDMKTRFGE